jgi:hypothetical protein
LHCTILASWINVGYLAAAAHLELRLAAISKFTAKAAGSSREVEEGFIITCAQTAAPTVDIKPIAAVDSASPSPAA